MTFTCKDFPGECCEDCHEKNHHITVFPGSCYTKTKFGWMPDLSMGLNAEICCKRYDYVRSLPREWWVRELGKHENYTEEQVEKLLKADGNDWFQVWGQIASEKWNKTHPPLPSRVSRITQGPARPRARLECPQCGDAWGGVACGNCGYTG